MLSALKNRAISRLWAGQALSSIGDEVYRVGLTWLAVGLLGHDTGLLAAAQAAALMVLSFVGGRWADNWEPLHTMVRVDLLRAALVLIPVVVSFFQPVPLALLVAVALLLAALSAFFDPALQSTLPFFAPEAAGLRGATGLMSTTIRLARMVGPTLVGLLSGFIPLIQFFTLDAASFLCSAWSIHSIKERVPAPIERGAPRTSFADSISSGFRLVRAQPGMSLVLATKAVTGGTWSLAFMLGIALLVQQLAPGDARAFGLVVAGYGAGNFAGALYFGNHPRPHPGRLMFSGYAALGSGFVLLGLAPTTHWMMLAAVFCGIAGPMNELAFSDLVQARFSVREIARVFRLRMAVETSSTLLCMGFSPLLFRLLGVRGTIVACGLAWISSGALGLSRRAEAVRAA